MAYINIYNIMNGIEKLFIDNKESIQQVIYDFHGEKTERYLHLYKGMMPTLPQDSFPSLEMEPGTMQNSWLTTECEYNTYTINFTLTTNEQNNRRGVNYISTLSRKLVEILTFPNNRAFIIPDEVIWNPVTNRYEQAWVQYGDVSTVQYGYVKDGTIRIAQWEWTGKILEGYDYPWYHKHEINRIPNVPHAPPKDN